MNSNLTSVFRYDSHNLLNITIFEHQPFLPVGCEDLETCHSRCNNILHFAKCGFIYIPEYDMKAVIDYSLILCLQVPCVDCTAERFSLLLYSKIDYCRYPSCS